MGIHSSPLDSTGHTDRVPTACTTNRHSNTVPPSPSTRHRYRPGQWAPPNNMGMPYAWSSTAWPHKRPICSTHRLHASFQGARGGKALPPLYFPLQGQLLPNAEPLCTSFAERIGPRTENSDAPTAERCETRDSGIARHEQQKAIPRHDTGPIFTSFHLCDQGARGEPAARPENPFWRLYCA